MRLLREYISKLLESGEFEWTPEMKATWKDMSDVDRRNAELVHGVGRMNPDVVYGQLSQTMQANARAGETFLSKALDRIAAGEIHKAALTIMDALWITDVSIDAEDDLEASLTSVQNEDDLAGAVAEWVPRHWKVNAQGRIMGRK